MADTNFVSRVTSILAAWLQPVNDLLYKGRLPNYATTTGSGNAQVLTLAGGSLYTASVTGDTFLFTAGFTNSGAATLAVGGTSAAAIQSRAAALVGSEIIAGSVYSVTWTGTVWQLLSHSLSLPLAVSSGGTGSITAAAARTALGSTTTGDALFIAASVAAARTTLGLATGDTPAFTGVAVNTVAFPATQVPSADPNTLDDYEEGTWTPSVGGTATYSTQTGRYIKIGRLVFINGSLILNLIGTGSTTVISGLPFAADATVGRGSITISSSGSLATAVVSLVGDISAGGSSITIRSRIVAAVSDGTSAIFGDSASVLFSGCYITD